MSIEFYCGCAGEVLTFESKEALEKSCKHCSAFVPEHTIKHEVPCECGCNDVIEEHVSAECML